MTTELAEREAAHEHEREADIKVLDARFVASAPTLDALPAPTLPEIAFMGRSNVGKSSLINTLVMRKNLVRTSKTPGQTRAINQFHVDVQLRRRVVSFLLIDLPGYGYARINATEKTRLTTLLSDYLSQRESLVGVVHIVDLRHGMTKNDLDVHRTLLDVNVTRLCVGTKADQVKAQQRRAHRDAIAKASGVVASAVTAFSSETREGRLVLWAKMLQVEGLFGNAAPRS
jgi:GTP-binding protein